MIIKRKNPYTEIRKENVKNRIWANKVNHILEEAKMPLFILIIIILFYNIVPLI